MSIYDSVEDHSVMEDILAHHSDRLDVAFAPQGMDIFDRNKGFQGKPEFVYFFREDRFRAGLTDRAMTAYARFMAQVDAEVVDKGYGLGKSRFANVVKPFLKHLDVIEAEEGNRISVPENLERKYGF